MTYSTRWKTDMLYTDKMFLCKQKNIILLVLFKQIEQKRIAYCFVGVEGWKECSMQLVVSISVSSLDFFFCVCVCAFICLFQHKSLRNHKWAEIFHRRACQNICSFLVPCHLMARGLKTSSNSFEDVPKVFKQTF